jgi:SRSO17 transposase
MQRMFTTARRDAGGVRDDLRGYVASAIGGPDGVLIGDGTGFEKGGSASAGVQRQSTGTAGKITNCQLGVFLACASPKGRALVDRELYLPRSWTGDAQRLAAAGVPGGTVFRTKPRLLDLMIGRAVAAGIPLGWVTVDEAYGGNGPLRAYLEEREIGETPRASPRQDECAGYLARVGDPCPRHRDQRGWSPGSERASAFATALT